MPRNGSTGSWGRYISNFQRNHQVDFQCGSTNLHCHQQLCSPWHTISSAWAVHLFFDLSHSEGWKISEYFRFAFPWWWWLWLEMQGFQAMCMLGFPVSKTTSNQDTWDCLESWVNHTKINNRSRTCTRLDDTLSSIYHITVTLPTQLLWFLTNKSKLPRGISCIHRAGPEICSTS